MDYLHYWNLSCRHLRLDGKTYAISEKLLIKMNTITSVHLLFGGGIYAQSYASTGYRGSERK